MKIKDTQILLEQIALLFASFIWTVIVLAVVTLPNLSAANRNRDTLKAYIQEAVRSASHGEIQL